MPAMKITDNPLMATSKEVPKSGCPRIKSEGSATIKNAISSSRRAGANAFFDNHQATASGMATFITSDG